MGAYKSELIRALRLALGSIYAITLLNPELKGSEIANITLNEISTVLAREGIDIHPDTAMQYAKEEFIRMHLDGD